jgi:hypothetical protein
MIAPLLLAAVIARGPVVPVRPPATVTDSWLCAHVSAFFCPIFPTLGPPGPSRPPRDALKTVEPRKP